MLIDRIVRWLVPRQDVFFTLLEDLAAKISAAAAVFGELITAAGHDQFTALSGRVKALETEADHVCHLIYVALDKTFVTPIDREDLAHLTGALDDIVDDMDHAAAFAALYHFDALTVPMRQLVEITTRSVAEVAKAIGNLRRFDDPESVREPNAAVHKLENEADAVFRVGIEQLFANGIDTRELVRQKDMLATLENGVDRCKDAMDVIRSVVVKNG
jgi:uncharacterized protein Yka (UPF0111/DUF47 family)